MKIGLMLGGGGAKGSFQVGVIEVLEKYGLMEKIEIISGASIGAINAYFYLGSNLNSLKQSWVYGITNNPIHQGINLKNKGLWSIDILKEINKKFINEEKFKNSKQQLYLVTTEIKSPTLMSVLNKSAWKEKVFHLNEEEKAIDYVISSASIPVVFGPNEIDDKYYIDGGLINNNPIDVLIEKGCKLIFAVPLEKAIDYKKFELNDITIVELTDLSVFPLKGIGQLVSIIDFNLEDMANKIEYGKYVAQEMLKQCLNEDVLTFNEGKFEVNKLKPGFHVIEIPEYIKSTLQSKIYVNEHKEKEEV